MNAVDKKNNLVGFDTDDDCCAHGGWFVKPIKLSKNDEFFANEQSEAIEYPDYEFDPKFFESTENSEVDGDSGFVRFRMVALNKPDLFLHLFNCHSGYYSKGFEYSFGELKKEGYL